MIETVALVATQLVGSGLLSIGIARFSPTIGPRLRHAFSGMAPLAVPFAWMLAGAESVSLNQTHLAIAAGLAALGTGTSIALTGRRGGQVREPRRLRARN